MLVAAGVFVATLLHATLYAPDNSSYAPPQTHAAITAAATTTPGQLPARLIIPKLGVDASVQDVGLTKAGSMGVPSNFTDAAWYKYGPVPGQRGSAVIDGHVDNGLSLPGVFKNLHQLQPGDDVYVQTAGGAKLHFIVRDVQEYPYMDVPAAQIFSRNDAARLNLITCTGSWVRAGRTYDRRLVVYATLSPA